MLFNKMGGFAVVEFVNEKAVGIIHESWIETCDGVMYCYWPSSNVAAKLKKGEIPDKKTWQRCRIRVFSYADNYEKALKQEKCAESTSNVKSESESETPVNRKRTRPSKSRYTELPDWSSDDEQRDCQGKKPKRFDTQGATYTPVLPVPPTLSASNFTVSSFQQRPSPGISNVGNKRQKNKIQSHSTDTPSLPVPPTLQVSNSNRTQDLQECGMKTSNDLLLGGTMPAIVNAFHDMFTPNHFDQLLNPDATIAPTNTSSFPRMNTHESQRDFDGTDIGTQPFNRSSRNTLRNNELLEENQHENQHDFDGTSCSTPPFSASCRSTPSRRNNQSFQEEIQHKSQPNFDYTNSGTPPFGRNTSIGKYLAGSNQQENFQRCVLTKLDIMAQKQDEALSMLRLLLSATRGIGGSDMLEDVLPKPIDTVDELEGLSARLDDDEFRKKMLHFLVALCSHTCAVSTRRILTRLGINKLWSSYSLKGRKSKRPFKDLSMCWMVIKACLRVHKTANEVEVEEQIAEFLKHAPHKPGGLRYKNRDIGSTTAAK